MPTTCVLDTREPAPKTKTMPVPSGRRLIFRLRETLAVETFRSPKNVHVPLGFDVVCNVYIRRRRFSVFKKRRANFRSKMCLLFESNLILMGLARSFRQTRGSELYTKNGPGEGVGGRLRGTSDVPLGDECPPSMGKWTGRELASRPPSSYASAGRTRNDKSDSVLRVFRSTESYTTRTLHLHGRFDSVRGSPHANGIGQRGK